jgi:acetyl esterase/lipase
MISAEAARLNELFAELRASGRVARPDLPIEKRRAGVETINDLATEPDGVVFKDEVIAGVTCKWATPMNATLRAVVMYMHGGGWIVGSVESHRRFVGHLANAVGCPVVSVDYRLAPEHPYPAPVDDCLAVYRELVEVGFPPSSVALAGDSAGAALVVSTLVRIRDDGLAPPAGGISLSAPLDQAMTSESWQRNANIDLLVHRALQESNVSMYLAGRDVHDPVASPLYADLRGLAPLYLQIGGDEVLLDDSTRLAAKAAAAGVEIRLDVFPEMQHVFQLAAGRVPEADDALGRIGQWLGPRLNLRPTELSSPAE